MANVLRVDEIKNSAGTGATKASNGLTVGGATRYNWGGDASEALQNGGWGVYGSKSYTSNSLIATNAFYNGSVWAKASDSLKSSLLQSLDGQFIFQNENTLTSFGAWTELARLNSSGLSFDGGVNYLDDYEEGTWTPTNAGGSGTWNNAFYSKVGNMVNVTVFFDNYTFGNATIGGLPYVVKGYANWSIGYTTSTNLTGGYGAIFTNNIVCTNLISTSIPNGTSLMIRFTYQTN